MTPATARRIAVLAGLTLLALAAPLGAFAAEGQLRWGLHVTLAAKWLDPAETEAVNTPDMIMYAVHDPLVKPMPAGRTTPSLPDASPEWPDDLTQPLAP